MTDRLNRTEYLALDKRQRTLYGSSLMIDVLTSGQTTDANMTPIVELARWELFERIVEPILDNDGQIPDRVFKDLKAMDKDALIGAAILLAQTTAELLIASAEAPSDAAHDSTPAQGNYIV